MAIFNDLNINETDILTITMYIRDENISTQASSNAPLIHHHKKPSFDSISRKTAAIEIHSFRGRRKAPEYRVYAGGFER